MMGKHSTLYHFDETRADTLDKQQCHHFPYDELDGDTSEEVYEPEEVEKMGEILREMLTWLTMGDKNSEGYGKTVMRKAIAMCWVLRPELFNGEPLSEIAKKKGINVFKQSLSKQAINFSKKFNIKGRGQRKKL
jgi:hypothetical protein